MGVHQTVCLRCEPVCHDRAVLTPSRYVSALTREVAAFSELLGSADLERPVPGCPGWTVRDLAGHLGGVHRWATGVLVTGEPGQERSGPENPNDLLPWFAEGGLLLLSALEGIDPQTPVWTFGPKPRVAEFWFRRQALETLVHLWDLQRAIEVPLTRDDELAGDGVDEVVTMFFPRQIRLERMMPLAHSLALEADDLDVSYVLAGDGTMSLAADECDVRVTGSAADLLLALWGRIDVAMLSVSGDVLAARDVMSAPLTP